jgi:hypothetical protein
LIWFRKEPNLRWFDGPGESASTIKQVFQFLDARLAVRQVTSEPLATNTTNNQQPPTNNQQPPSIDIECPKAKPAPTSRTSF